ncbi:hypothetical protein TcasGA2_TC007254 [Tribolium castaneum]|uniref:Uncharacterized protein n=1 Tax=Tribolium castaneum TaxID=7070 RepID=D2A0I3_TRICA|nr:PREDICTED: putative lysozyme-like protein isoform X1 [Tribolium castaneum]EFA01680.2 hypothetical protein TcasGA2_TC007254 [Tribolium castaneum]|eukprot:XP_008192335.2 PREDICTED: putative lysozyme-like protein isoform X1 [Tribolium castaneum]
MSPILILLLITVASGVPINMVQKAADNDFEKLDNYLPKVGDFPKFHYSTFGGNTGSDELTNVIEFKSKENAKSLGSVMDFVKDGASAGVDLLKDVGSVITSTLHPETTTEQETTTVPYEATTELEITTKTLVQLDPVFLENVDDNTNRTIRQDGDDDNDVEVDKDKSNDKEKESQESDEEEEDQNMITGLLSAFLSGLSRPDGSVDVEAITGLLGSLSTQNPDGSYDFNGLTELLMSFFGGGGEEGGGSDFGAFLGGLLGAFIKGVAQPPGAKGSGIFVGNLLTGILPALSGPAPTEEGQTEKPQPPLDSGGFLGGLLSSIAGSSGSFSAGSSGGNNNANGGGGGSKFSLFKAIFSMITSVFSSSSAAH